MRYLSVEFMLLFIFFCIILLSEKKRNQASEGKGLEMEPLKPKGLLIHAFVLLCLGPPNFPFSIYLLGVCYVAQSHRQRSSSLLFANNLLVTYTLLLIINIPVATKWVSIARKILSSYKLYLSGNIYKKLMRI